VQDPERSQTMTAKTAAQKPTAAELVANPRRTKIV
jgi:hypothetical protein